MGVCEKKHKIIETNIERLRDPFVLTENGTRYMYGTNWVCYKSSDSLEHWTKVEKELVVVPSDCDDDK